MDFIVGIVGAEGAKFTPYGEALAKALIDSLLTRPGVTGVCSGRCHLGGIDIWAEEIGRRLRLIPYIYPPRQLNWTNGYRHRNIRIAEVSTEVHCITVDSLPSNFKGMKFDFCYHCMTNDHIKSGGCWTAKYAQTLDKSAFWHTITNTRPS